MKILPQLLVRYSIIGNVTWNLFIGFPAIEVHCVSSKVNYWSQIEIWEEALQRLPNCAHNVAHGLLVDWIQGNVVRILESQRWTVCNKLRVCMPPGVGLGGHANLWDNHNSSHLGVVLDVCHVLFRVIMVRSPRAINKLVLRNLIEIEWKWMWTT